MRVLGHLFDGIRGLGQCEALHNWQFARWVASKHIMLPNVSLDSLIEKKKIADFIIIIMEGYGVWVDSHWELDMCWVLYDGSSPANLDPFGRHLPDQVHSKTYQMEDKSLQTAQEWYSCCIYGIYGLHMSGNYSNEVDKDEFKFLWVIYCKKWCRKTKSPIATWTTTKNNWEKIPKNLSLVLDQCWSVSWVNLSTGRVVMAIFVFSRPFCAPKTINGRADLNDCPNSPGKKFPKISHWY